MVYFHIVEKDCSGQSKNDLVVYRSTQKYRKGAITIKMLLQIHALCPIKYFTTYTLQVKYLVPRATRVKVEARLFCLLLLDET